MACGTLVIASNAGALPEVGGDCGLFFDPLDVAEMAESLLCGIRETGVRKALREKGLRRARDFSWDCSARLMSKVFEGCS
jgi:glycosyltransferase involved in cell wall biosynthesis